MTTRAALARLPAVQAALGRAPAPKIAGRAVGHLQPGWREIGGQRHYFRSKAEIRYALYLEWLKGQGHILAWTFEAREYDFTAPRVLPDGKRLKGVKHGVTRYKIDFEVTEPTGEVAVHEVKGWMDAQSKTRINRLRRYYPEVKLVVIGPKTMADIRKMAALIPGWE